MFVHNRGKLPRIFTKTGVGTVIAEGKETRDFDGETYLMEHSLKGDLAVVTAWKGDKLGNLMFRKTARNFNAPMATAGKTCVVEVENLVEVGDIEPDQIHLPGIYVDRIFEGQNFEKRIERRTIRDS